MASLAILWRNPKAVKHQTRFRQIEKSLDRKVYAVEELLSPRKDFWVTTAMFELFRCDVRPASGASKGRTWRIRFGGSLGLS
jgi:hypothetical protein